MSRKCYQADHKKEKSSDAIVTPRRFQDDARALNPKPQYSSKCSEGDVMGLGLYCGDLAGFPQIAITHFCGIYRNPQSLGSLRYCRTYIVVGCEVECMSGTSDRRARVHAC